MKPETVAIFSFLVSLIAYEFFFGLLWVAYSATFSSSSSSVTAATGVVTVAIVALLAALLTGLKVYALERS